MNNKDGVQALSAPCIVEEGILINQDDIKRLLTDLCHVNYVHTIDGKICNKGQGLIQEIFSDAHQSTLIANEKMYINIQSFDYLHLSKSTKNETCFDLIQEHRQLRLIPVKKKGLCQSMAKSIDAEAIEAMVTEVLTARLDVQLDDDF